MVCCGACALRIRLTGPELRALATRWSPERAGGWRHGVAGLAQFVCVRLFFFLERERERERRFAFTAAGADA